MAMAESPSSLQSFCIDCISDNIDTYCQVRGGWFYLHARLSECLLEELGHKGLLNDQTLAFFEASTTRLERVVLQRGDALTCRGLSALRGHCIIDLEAPGLNVTVADLIDQLGRWTIQHLRSLDVTGCSFVDASKVAVTVSLSRLHNLRCLNVSQTEFNSHGLEIVAEDLKMLESLDISESRVTDIGPLLRCSDRLQVLVMHNLKLSNAATDIIVQLHRLRYLDLSRDADFSRFEVYVLFDYVTSPMSTSQLLCRASQPHVLERLESLDISGCDTVDIEPLVEFVQRHPKLTFLGLLDCEASFADIFCDHTHPFYRHNLLVTGLADEQQIFESLRRYPKRMRCTQQALYSLFALTHQFTEPRMDAIELVLRAMRLHPVEFPIQMAATACLYNLIKGEIGQKIHPHRLKEVVQLTLTAMENFPNNLQLQKNTLLTLCSDRILQDVTFDRYRCTRLVLDCLCSFDDLSMGRMSVAICSILAAKISTAETTVLGSTPKYMRKLLSIVRTKKEQQTVDITLKFTLSALWNLTDESPDTCGVFLREGGLDLFLQVLEQFPGEPTVETKILGLINNIAEVSSLRQRLMVDAFLVALHRLLRSPLIDVAYFAAGIVAHLASAGPALWRSQAVPRDTMLQELETVVLNWNSPESEMVAYRSFSPFFHLVLCYEAPQVQLWALWAIQHVCTKNAKRYCSMLFHEEGDRMLRSIAHHPGASPAVRHFCLSILQLLLQEGLARSSEDDQDDLDAAAAQCFPAAATSAMSATTTFSPPPSP